MAERDWVLEEVLDRLVVGIPEDASPRVSLCGATATDGSDELALPLHILRVSFMQAERLWRRRLLQNSSPLSTQRKTTSTGQSGSPHCSKSSCSIHMLKATLQYRVLMPALTSESQR